MSLLPNLDELDDEQKMAVLESVQKSIAQSKEIQKRKIGENVDLVVQALKKIEEDIRSRYDDIGNAIEKRVASIKDGRDGINGRDGKDGKDGKQGKEGRPGRDGKDGKNGLNGVDGQDGVSVVNAHIDFDGSLIISLSSGKEINVGEVVAPALAEQIKVITNGGGTSQSVLDTLTSLQSQIDAIGDAVVYKGLWNASTNSPTITSGVGTSGNFYIVSVAGSTNLDGITNWKEGDWAVFNGVAWQRVEGGADGNFTTVTASSLTSGRVTYAGTGGLLQDSSNLTFNGTTLTSAGFSGPLNGTVGATTPSTGAFTTLSSTGNTTLGDATTDTVTVNGYMGVGGAANASRALSVTPNALTGTNQFGVFSTPTGSTGGTSSVSGLYTAPASAASAYTVNSMRGVTVDTFTKGAGSTITDLHGLYIADQTQGTNNYGITSAVSSGANKWNIYASGTANNYFAGNVGIGTSSPTLPLTVDGEISTLFDNNGTALEATAVFIGNGNSASTATHARVAIIGSTTGTVGELYFTNRGVGSYNSFGCGIRGGYAGADARNNTLTFFTSHTTDENVERMRIDSAGNVGIGTSSPSATDRLTIGDGAVANNASISINGGSNSARGTGIKFSKAGTAVGFIGSASWLEGGTSDALAFSANSSATVAMRIDSSGNLGLGVTPSAWSSSVKALEIGRIGNGFVGLTSGSNSYVSAGAYFDGTWKYSHTGVAAGMYSASSSHAWFTAPSGTAGNAISFTQAMTLDASGRLLIGSTSSNSAFGGNLQVEGTSGAFSSFVRYSTSAAGAPGLYLARSKGATVGTNTIVASGDTLGNLLFSGANGTGYSDAASISAFVDGTPGASADMPGRLVFSTSSDGSATPTERMRIDSSGNVGIGTSSPNDKLTVASDNYLSFQTSSTTFNSGRVARIGGVSVGSGNGYLSFETYQGGSGGGERMRLESDGLLQISKGTYTGFWIGDAGYKMFVTAGRLVAQNGSNGVELAFNASAWAAYSDIRAKTSLTPITDAKTKLKTARTVTGRYITDSEDVSRSFLIAQDWFEILPESVDASDPERLSLRYTETIPLIAAAVNEQTDEIAELKAIIESLTARIAALEAQ